MKQWVNLMLFQSRGLVEMTLVIATERQPFPNKPSQCALSSPPKKKQKQRKGTL